MITELKPCPFCGNSALTRSVDGGCLPLFMDLEKQQEIMSKTPYTISCSLSCDECGARIEGYAATDNLNNGYIFDKAIEDCYQKWNRRTKNDL